MRDNMEKVFCGDDDDDAWQHGKGVFFTITMIKIMMTMSMIMRRVMMTAILMMMTLIEGDGE